MSVIIVKDGKEPMVHEAMAYVESLGIPATQIRRITVDAKVGQPLVVGLELFVPVAGAEPEREGFLFGADVHGGSSDGYGSVAVDDCRWPDERCHGHWRGAGTEPQKSDSGTCVIVGEMCTTHGQHASRCAPQKSNYGVDLKSTASVCRNLDHEHFPSDPVLPTCTDNTPKSHYGATERLPEFDRNGCPVTHHSADYGRYIDPEGGSNNVAFRPSQNADDVACSGEREGICSGGPAHHPGCPSAQPRKLIGPPSAHLDAPCTDACYEAAETVLWIDQDGKGHTAVPGVDMTDTGWTLA
jgi:hypothetical protein